MPPPEFNGGTVTVPQKANSFTFDGTSYGPGDRFRSNDPCAVMGFAQAFSAANPSVGRSNRTPQFWENAASACAGQPQTTAGDTDATPAGSGGSDGGVPAGDGDSATAQGAPALTDPPLVAADDAGGAGQGGQGGDGGTGGGDPSPTSEPRRPPTGTVNPRQVAEPPESPLLVNDPVDLFSGGFAITETDLRIENTIMPLQFTRGYRSGPGFFGPLGWNWDHNFNVYLRELATGDVAVWRWMHEDVFHFDGAAFQPRRGLFERLERVGAFGTEWELTGPGGTITHFERPAGWVDGERIPIAWVRDRHGNTLTFTYGTGDHLVAVTDDAGNALEFGYDACGLLVEVRDHTGRSFTYEHDEEAMHLVGYTTPPVTDHPAGITRRYEYQPAWVTPELRHAIVRTIDGDGRTFIENTYDEEPASLSYGRVLEQYYGGYLHQYRYEQLQVVPNHDAFVNVAAWQAEVMNPDYGVASYTFNFRGDLLDERLRLVKDGSNRVVVRTYLYDEQGQVAEAFRPDGSSTRYTRAATDPDPRRRGLVTKVEEFPAAGFPVPSRIVWQGTYDPVYQQLVTETDETGSVTTYVHDFNAQPGAPTNTGKLVEIVRPAATLPDGTPQASSTRFEHRPNGLLEATVAADGLRTELGYGAGVHAGRVVQQVVDPGGLAITTRFDYDGAGRVVAVTDPLGATTTNVVNALGLTERVIPPDVGPVHTETVIHYDRDRRVVRVVRPRGDYDDATLAGRPIEDVIERDELGNPVELVLGANTAEARTIRTDFDFRSAPTTIVHPDGSTTRNVYDERGLLVRRTRSGADGSILTERWAYDRAGRLTHEFSDLGRLRRREYDPFGRLHRVTHLNGTVHEVEYGLADRPSSTRVVGDDGTGTTRQLGGEAWTYDELGRRVTATVLSFDDDPTTAVPLTTAITHDVVDRIVRSEDHRGGAALRAYDAAGRLSVETDPNGNEVVLTRDAAGRVTRTEQRWASPGGVVSLRREQVYDARGRLVARVHPDGSAQQVDYDERDLPVGFTDESGVTTSTSFNAFAERTAETVDPGGLAILHRWTLDGAGRPVAYVDPTGQTTTTILDGLGRVVGQTFPAGNSLLRSLSPAGRVASEWTGAGNRCDYDYDAAGRLARIVNAAQAAGAAAVPERTYRYDGLDRVVEAEVTGDPASGVSRRYDSLGRLRAETSAGATVLRSYDDLAGQVVTTWPDGRRERATLDPLGLVSEIDQLATGTLGTSAGPVASLVPLGPSHVARLTRGPVVVERDVDERGRLTDVECRAGGALLERLAYRFDVRDRLGLDAQHAHPSRARTATLDPAGRLVSVATAPGGAVPGPAPDQTTQLAQIAALGAGAATSHQYGYDAADTLLSCPLAGHPPLAAVAGAAHRYSLLAGNAVAYRADGTLESYDGRVVTSDALGRVLAVARGGAVSSITYDALNRVGSVTDGGVTQRWVYFGDQVVEERAGGLAVAQYTRNLTMGEALCRHVSGARQHPLVDLRGSLRAILSDTGQPLAWYDYGPYGAVTVHDPSGAVISPSAAPAPAVFGGMRYLAEAELLVAGKRVLDPRWGIFLSTDPFGYADSANLYTYAGGGPFDRIDPDGDLAFLAILGVMAVGALVAGGINATRQGIAMAENPARRAEGFSFGELAMSMGIGAVAAPILVFAPEVAIPMAGLGLASGANEISNGNYATGAFDIVTAIAPFGSKNVRTGSFGRGTVPGEWAGLGPRATASERWARFDMIASNPRGTMEPSPFGEEAGIGIARPPGADGGHSGVFLDLPDGPILFHKNGQPSSNPAWRYEAAWMREPPPSEYFNGRQMVPWDYTTSRVPRGMWQSMLNEAQGRQAFQERFAFKPSAEGPPMSCGYYTGDVFAAGGVQGIPTGNSTVVFPYVSQFLNTRNAASLAWGAGFWSHVPGTSTPNRKCVPGQ
jgi:RHS repeat-associated protein